MPIEAERIVVGLLSEPWGCCGESDDGEAVSRGFLETGCDATEFLELGEAAFDEVAPKPPASVGEAFTESMTWLETTIFYEFIFAGCAFWCHVQAVSMIVNRSE